MGSKTKLKQIPYQNLSRVRSAVKKPAIQKPRQIPRKVVR